MGLNCSTVKDVTKAIEENSIEFVDLKFTDLYGQMCIRDSAGGEMQTRGEGRGARGDVFPIASDRASSPPFAPSPCLACSCHCGGVYDGSGSYPSAAMRAL